MKGEQPTICDHESGQSSRRSASAPGGARCPPSASAIEHPVGALRCSRAVVPPPGARASIADEPSEMTQGVAGHPQSLAPVWRSTLPWSPAQALPALQWLCLPRPPLPVTRRSIEGAEEVGSGGWTSSRGPGQQMRSECGALGRDACASALGTLQGRVRRRRQCRAHAALHRAHRAEHHLVAPGHAHHLHRHGQTCRPLARLSRSLAEGVLAVARGGVGLLVGLHARGGEGARGQVEVVVDEGVGARLGEEAAHAVRHCRHTQRGAEQHVHTRSGEGGEHARLELVARHGLQPVDMCALLTRHLHQRRLARLPEEAEQACERRPGPARELCRVVEEAVVGVEGFALQGTREGAELAVRREQGDVGQGHLAQLARREDAFVHVHDRVASAAQSLCRLDHSSLARRRGFKPPVIQEHAKAHVPRRGRALRRRRVPRHGRQRRVFAGTRGGRLVLLGPERAAATPHLHQELQVSYAARHGARCAAHLLLAHEPLQARHAHAAPREPVARGLEARDAAEAGRDAHGATNVCPNPQGGTARADEGALPTRRPARRAGHVPAVAARAPEGKVLRGHHELGRGRAHKGDRTRAPSEGHNERVLRRRLEHTAC
mmetsp:Transcript_22507/g.60891  ORF Transcript_22507/g.60891 Transcript_22507/m.60891 type:complete len:605 (+) Transcript_22507:578-2392(+)